MPNLKDLRNRINSVGATRKITRAMQMVAASKLRRTQEAIIAARPYAESMHKTVSALAMQTEKGLLSSSARRFFDPPKNPQNHLLIVMTSQRGLCGGFNNHILNLALKNATQLKQKGQKIKFICVGKKAFDRIKRQGREQILKNFPVHDNALAIAHDMTDLIENVFKDNQFDHCTMFYSRFYSVLSQEPTQQQLIPIKKVALEQNTKPDRAIYSYEPDEEQMLDALLPSHLKAQLLRGLLENAAGEQGARMTAMDSATRNADDMIADLSLTYNRTRQAVITKELTEIISGAEALSS